MARRVVPHLVDVTWVGVVGRAVGIPAGSIMAPRLVPVGPAVMAAGVSPVVAATAAAVGGAGAIGADVPVSLLRREGRVSSNKQTKIQFEPKQTETRSVSIVFRFVL